MRCAVKCCVFIEIYGEFETFSTSSAPSGHLLLKEKALVLTNPLAYMQRDPLFIVGTATGSCVIRQFVRL